MKHQFNHRDICILCHATAEYIEETELSCEDALDLFNKKNNILHHKIKDDGDKLWPIKTEKKKILILR